MKCDIPVSKEVYLAMVDICYLLCCTRDFDYTMRIMIREFCTNYGLSSPLKILSEELE